MKTWHRSRTGATLMVAALAVTAGACPAPEQERAGVVDTAAVGTPGAPATGTMTAAQAFNAVSAANAAEISTSTLARDRAQNSDVRQFAERMINDHQEAQGRLDRVAIDLGVVQQPYRTDTLTGAFEERRRELSDMQAGAEFDRRYMDIQVELHEGALQTLNDAANVADEQMRSAIQNTIPTVQQHLEQAREIRGRLNQAGQSGQAARP